jgi:hypothetical protein
VLVIERFCKFRPRGGELKPGIFFLPVVGFIGARAAPLRPSSTLSGAGSALANCIEHRVSCCYVVHPTLLGFGPSS